MFTLTVDDRQLIVTMVQTILGRLDPEGTHLGASKAADALRLAEENPVDVAFLDVEMPGMNGIELAERLQARYPLINIVFITGYQEYMPEAFRLYASDYIMKPVTEEALSSALSHLRNRRTELAGKPLEAHCFGTFEVFCRGKPVSFSRSKTKELLAFLIDQNGAVCSNDRIIGNLWPDEPANASIKSQLRTITADLRITLEGLGAGSVISHKDRAGLGIDPSQIDCDYYRYLDGDPVAIHQFRGEYMEQYAFAEEKRAELQRKFYAE